MDLGVEFLWSAPQKRWLPKSKVESEGKKKKKWGGFMFTKDCISYKSVYSQARSLSRRFNFRVHTCRKLSIHPQRWIYVRIYISCIFTWAQSLHTTIITSGANKNKNSNSSPFASFFLHFLSLSVFCFPAVGKGWKQWRVFLGPNCWWLQTERVIRGAMGRLEEPQRVMLLQEQHTFSASQYSPIPGEEKKLHEKPRL